MKYSNRKKAALLFAVLLFPSILYVVFSSGKHTFLYRPVLGPKTVDVNGDTLYHSVAPFRFKQCNNKVVSSAELEGKILIVGFYNNSDSLLSTRMCNQMMTLHEKFRTNDDIVLLSLSTSNDSSSLKEACRIEREFPIDESKWFLGILEGDIVSFATQQLWFDEVQNTKEKFDYSKLVLLDKARRIRSYSDATQYSETKILGDDIKVVIAEEFMPKKEKKLKVNADK